MQCQLIKLKDMVLKSSIKTEMSLVMVQEDKWLDLLCILHFMIKNKQ